MATSMLDKVLGRKREGSKNGPSHRQQAESLERQGRFAQAAEHYAEAGEWLNAGHCYRKAEEWEKAADAYRHAEEWMAASECEERGAAARERSERQDVREFWRTSARQHEDEGEWARAAADYEKVQMWTEAARCHEKAERWLNAAQCHERAGETVAAARCYRRSGHREKAAELFEEGGAWTEAGAEHEILEDWTRAGDCYVKGDDLTGARRCYERAERWDRLASVAFKDDSFDEGIELLIKSKRNHMAAKRLFRRAAKNLDDPPAALADVKRAYACYNVVGLRGAMALLEGIIARDEVRVLEGAAILESGKGFEARAANELITFAQKAASVIRKESGPAKRKKRKHALELIEDLVRKGTISRVEYERLKKKYLKDVERGDE